MVWFRLGKTRMCAHGCMGFTRGVGRVRIALFYVTSTHPCVRTPTRSHTTYTTQRNTTQCTLTPRLWLLRLHTPLSEIPIHDRKSDLSGQIGSKAQRWPGWNGSSPSSGVSASLWGDRVGTGRARLRMVAVLHIRPIQNDR